jgi:hypothetical protein
MKYKTGKGYIISNYGSGDEETELEQRLVKLYAKRYSSESLWSLPKDLIQALARNDEVHYCRSCNQHTFTDIYWREEVSAGNAEQFCSHCDDYKPDTDDWYAVRANIDYDSYTEYRINSIIKSLNAIDEKFRFEVKRYWQSPIQHFNARSFWALEKQQLQDDGTWFPVYGQMSEPSYIFLGYDYDVANYVLAGLVGTLMHAGLYKKHEGEEE